MVQHKIIQNAPYGEFRILFDGVILQVFVPSLTVDNVFPIWITGPDSLQEGQIVSLGIKAVTGMTMPVFEKRRFQHGAASTQAFNMHFPEREIMYRKEFLSNYE